MNASVPEYEETIKKIMLIRIFQGIIRITAKKTQNKQLYTVLSNLINRNMYMRVCINKKPGRKYMFGGIYI